MFDLVAPYEKELSADICTWGVADTKKVLEILSGFRSYSSENRANLLRRYVRWCIENGITGVSEAILTSKASGDLKVKEMTVSGPQHLDRILNVLFDPVSDATSDNILRGYCWLAFIGLSNNEIVSLRCNDVDINSFSIRTGSEEFQIIQEAVPCLRILKEMAAFRYSHPGYEHDFIWRPRLDGDKLLRGIRSANPSALHLRSMLSKSVNDAFKNGKIDVKISHYRMWISGEFYRAFLSERIGEPVDFSHLADRAIRIREENGSPYKLETENGKHSIEAKKREIESAYLSDYKRWKVAYSV